MSHAWSAPVRSLAVVAVAAAAVALHGCGGGGTDYNPAGQGTVVTQPTPPPPVVVSQMTGASLEAEWVGGVPFTTPRAGTLDVTVDWTYAANDVDAAIATGTCTLEQLEADQCQFVAFAVSETAKPERLQLANAAAGGYTLVLFNLGPGDESISYQVVLSPSAVAGSARAPVASPARWKRAPRGVRQLR